MSDQLNQNSQIDIKNTNHRFLIAKKLDQKLIHHQQDVTTKKEISVEREPQSATNIFLDQPSNKDFKQWLGPRYDNGGELLAYTLIGKPDWFQSEKLHDSNQNNTNKKVEQSTVVERLSVKMTQTVSSDKKVIFRKNEQIRTKNQLLDELVTIKDRIQANKLKDDKLFECLPENSKRIFNKQQYTLLKHEEQLDGWEQFVQKCSEKLERDPQLCQMNRAENYRAKLELAQNFDILKSDYERYGPNIWYMTLRNMQDKMEEDSRRQNKIITEKKEQDNIMIQQQQQLPSVFHSSSLGGVKNSLEYIRKPLRHNQSLSVFNHSIQSIHSRKHSMNSFLNSLQNSQSIPFYSFGSDKYLMERMGSCKKALNNQHMIQFDEANEIDQLCIQGQSQLMRETQQLGGTKENGVTFFTKYVEHPNGIQVQEEEILAENQSKVNQIKLPQITKMNRQRRFQSVKNDLSKIPCIIE